MTSLNVNVRESDNYLDGTRLAQVLDVKVSNWRASLGFSSRLQKIQDKTGLSESQLYQARRKYPTYLHPYLALDMVGYSKASNKNEVRAFIKRLMPQSENSEDESDGDNEVEVLYSTKQDQVVLEKEKSRLILGDVVVIQREDGMIDLTAICNAGGKKFKHWYENLNTKQFLEKKMQRLGLSIDKLVSIGDCTQQSSFGHPQVAIHLASWVSPSFADLVTEWVHTLLVKGSVSIEKNFVDLVLENKKEDRLREQLELDKKKWEKESIERHIGILAKSMDFVTRLSGGSLQPNDREFYKEMMINVTKNNTSLAINTTLSTIVNTKGEQVTLSIIANRMGYKLCDGDLCQLGKLIAKRYREKHNVEPEKHTQRHLGRMIPVNTYFECDISLMEKALDDYFSNKK